MRVCTSVLLPLGRVLVGDSLSLVLLTEELGSVDHVSEGTLDLVPFPGLQAAVCKGS